MTRARNALEIWQSINHMGCWSIIVYSLNICRKPILYFCISKRLLNNNNKHGTKLTNTSNTFLYVTLQRIILCDHSCYQSVYLGNSNGIKHYYISFTINNVEKEWSIKLFLEFLFNLSKVLTYLVLVTYGRLKWFYCHLFVTYNGMDWWSCKNTNV